MSKCILGDFKDIRSFTFKLSYNIGKKIKASAEEMLDNIEKEEVSAIKYTDERKNDNRVGFKLTLLDEVLR